MGRQRTLSWNEASLVTLAGTPLTHPQTRPGGDTPAWAAGATIYGVSVGHVDPPGLQGVIDRLDDFAGLGVAALWLSPINVSPPGDFGYAVVDYCDVRPGYGTRDDFRRLVREAHARDIRILMDVVPNHTSVQHPWRQDAERNGPASRWWGFYDRDGDGNATHYFSWTHLPNLNYDNPEVRRIMTGALLSWVREFDVDGFRVDVAWGIQQRNPEFWPAFVAEFRRLKPDGLLIAEASARDPRYAACGFDAAYDWTDALGHWAWEGIFDGATPVGTAITGAIAASDPATRVLRFLNNNDTGARFISRHGIDCYRVALAMLLTLPGLPCLYLGDEVGAAFEPYASREAVTRDDPHGLRAYVRDLVALRRALPGLAAPAWTPLAVEPAAHIFGYLRHRENGDDPVLVLLNFGPEAVEARVDPDALPGGGRGIAAWRDRLGKPAPCGGSTLCGRPQRRTTQGPPCEIGTVAMPGWGVRVLVPEAEGAR